MREIPSSLLIHRPDLPVEIDRLVMKLMAKNPADRYQSAAQMLADLAKIREVIQVPTPGQAGATETLVGMAERTEEIGATGASGVPAVRTRAPKPTAEVHPARPVVATEESVGEGEGPAFPRPRFSMLVASAVVAIGLGRGRAGRLGRHGPPTSNRSRTTRRSAPPGLWIEPRWSDDPQAGQPRRPVCDTPSSPPRATSGPRPGSPSRGSIPASHEATSKAYVQLARLWYRQDDVEALAALGSELEAWKQSQRRDKELAALIHLALDLKKGDLGAVEKGFAKLTEAEVADMYDASLVAFSLEVCADALKAVQNNGDADDRGAVAQGPAAADLAPQSDRDRRPRRAGRVNPGAAAGPRSSG